MRTAGCVLIAVATALASPALGQMMAEKMMGQGRPAEQNTPVGRAMCPQCRTGESFRAVRSVDVGALGLPAEAVTALEDQRFELRKTVIRKNAELAILRLELQRMVNDRGFDVTAAQQRAQAMANVEGEIHLAHLGFLHDLAAQVSDPQWQKLQQGSDPAVMPMMGGPGRMKGMMPGGPPGGMMPCGTMMPATGQGEHARHHPGTAEEAEEFFNGE